MENHAVRRHAVFNEHTSECNTHHRTKAEPGTKCILKICWMRTVFIRIEAPLFQPPRPYMKGKK